MHKIIFAAMATIALTSVASIARADTAPATPVAAAPSEWESYGSLGYNYLHGSPAGYSVGLGAVTGRVGMRYMRYFGAEAEVSAGIVDQTIGAGKISLENEYAVYAVGYLPVSPQADLFARVGYGNAKITAAGNGISVTASGNT